jgi:hypothetical protein
MTITVEQVEDNATQRRVTLSEARPRTVNHFSSHLDFECPLKLLNGKMVELKASYWSSNKTLGLALYSDGRVIYSAACRWDNLGPQFSIELADGSFIEIYCLADA